MTEILITNILIDRKVILGIQTSSCTATAGTRRGPRSQTSPAALYAGENVDPSLLILGQTWLAISNPHFSKRAIESALPYSPNGRSPVPLKAGHQNPVSHSPGTGIFASRSEELPRICGMKSCPGHGEVNLTAH